MDLYYRRPSTTTREAMSKAALNLKHLPGNRPDEMIKAEKSVKKFTQHKQVKIVNSGNSSILSVMSTFKNKIMIPDQGGWVGFKKMAEFWNIEIIILPTNLGLVELDVLVDFIEKYNPEALFITSFAGYMAEQSISDIYKVCDAMGVVMVEDASGGIGDDRGYLGNGENAHIILASTGSPKTVNVGNGGFISTNNTEIFDSAKNILNVVKADPITCAGIASEIENAPNILSKNIVACNYLKSEISDFNEILYENKPGLNVTIPSKNPKNLGYRLRKRLKVHGGSIITVCPNYNRVKLNSVCIEIKNLDIECLTQTNLDDIVEIIKNEI
jgi:hypothetical protein